MSYLHCGRRSACHTRQETSFCRPTARHSRNKRIHQPTCHWNAQPRLVSFSNVEFYWEENASSVRSTLGSTSFVHILSFLTPRHDGFEEAVRQTGAAIRPFPEPIRRRLGRKYCPRCRARSTARQTCWLATATPRWLHLPGDPYLGHVGLETFDDVGRETCVSSVIYSPKRRCGPRALRAPAR